LGIGALYVVAARRLPVGQYATFALAQALAGMFLAGAELGTTSMLADTIASDRRRARPASSKVLRLRLSLVLPVWVVIAGGLIVAAPGAPQADAVTAMIFLPVVVASVVTSTAESVLRALGRSWVEGLATAGFRVLQLGLSALWLAEGGGLDSLILVGAGIGTVAAATVSVAAWRSAPSVSAPVPAGAISLRRGRWLTAASLVSTVYDRLDTWLLALLAVPLAVATYASAYRIFGAVLLVANAVAALAVPLTAGRHGEDLVRVGRRLAAWALAFSAPAALVVMVAAPEILRVLFGPGYVGGASALRVLMVAVVPSSVGAALVPRAALLDGQRITGYFAASLVANVAIDLACIPELGALGAAIGTAICQGTMSWVVWRRFAQAARR
jgi:O-antigen/teichoic acid export membrane protein